MKKKHCKNIMTLANRMPKSYEKTIMTIGTNGKDLLKEDAEFVTKRDGSVNLEKTYINKRVVFININHYKRMKKAYTRNGTKGLMDYINWINRNNANLNSEFKDLKLEEVEDGLISLAKGSEKDFWRNFITFIMSFVANLDMKKKRYELLREISSRKWIKS